jgi:D-glycero-D-manno-heptose 1,7-bisphosphate phosphatase
VTGRKRPALFLDRDGTIIRDVGYPREPAQVELLPGVNEALRELAGRGFLLVLVSNQSGVGRGLVTPEEAERVHARVVERLAERGVRLDASYYCPHAPGDACRCRKPSPEMLLRAAERLGISRGESFMIGDKPSDVEAGLRAGCRTVLLAAGPQAGAFSSQPHYVAADWPGVLCCILNHATGEASGTP